jgi:uncharacterized protein with FMN-binding domain
VLNEKGAAASTSAAASGSSGAPSANSTRRTKPDLLAMIKQAGETPPDWFDLTPLDLPPSLDLAWTEPAPPPWDNQKNVGQYIWDIINPNPGRWRSGIRLIHHLMDMHKNDAAIQDRGKRTLGGMYFIFFQDYARAAHWWQEAGVNSRDRDAIALAECYWRLGNQAMAEQMLYDPERRPQGRGQLSDTMIKLWGDMGQTNKAIKLADLYVRSGGDAHSAYLFAGDACRSAGRFQEALKYYQKVVDTPSDNKGRDERSINRARANVEAIKLFELSDASKTRDGTHAATSPAYEGPLTVEVTVSAGRTEKVEVTKHTEKQFYSALTDVPNQIIEKQGVKGIDATSRATITAEAILNATARALAENPQ